MISLKIKKGTARLSDQDFRNRVAIILNSMNGNENFLNPNPPLADIQIVFDEFAEALQILSGMDASPRLRLKKNKLRKTLNKLLDRLLRYVCNQSDDIVILTSSGFPKADERTSTTKSERPYLHEIIAMDGGRVKATIDKVPRAVCYLYQYLPVSCKGENWLGGCRTRISILLDKLTPGIQYKFRVCAVTTKGQSSWSDERTCYVC